jgi:hypothetical protein
MFDEYNFMLKDHQRLNFMEQQIELNVFGKYGER